MDKAQNALKELMAAYDNLKGKWVAEYGTESGFDQWFTQYILAG